MGDSYGDYAYRRRRETMDAKHRSKRFTLGGGYDYGAGGYDYGGDAYGGEDYYGSDYYGDYDPAVLECLSNDPSGGHDANCWIKTPGEADGRLYASGTFHECLLEHNIECSDLSAVRAKGERRVRA